MRSRSIFVLFTAVMVIYSSTILCSRQISGEEIEGTREMIGVISNDTVGDISACWDPRSEEFIVVGGQDLFGKDENGNPDQDHTRFICSTNGEDLDIIEYIDNPDLRDYQRYIDVAVDPITGIALISGMNGGLWKLEGDEVTKIETGNEHPLWTVTWEPNGEYALIGTWDRLYRYENGVVSEVETNGHGCIGYSWSPDGKYVLLADNDDNEIGRYNGEKFKVLDLPSDGGKDLMVQTVAFSPKEEFALIGTQWGSVNGPYQNLFSFDGKNFKLIEEEINSFPETPYWTPDGRYVFITENKMMRYDMNNGTLEKNIEIPEYAHILGVQPDGDYLLTVRHNYHDEGRSVEMELWRWDLKPSEPGDDDITTTDDDTSFVPLSILILSIASMVTLKICGRKRSVER